jgi:hypothetical protein
VILILVINVKCASTSLSFLKACACALGAPINSKAERERAGYMLDNVPAIPLDVFEPKEVETVVQVTQTFQQVQIEVPVALAFTANSEDTLPFRP